MSLLNTFRSWLHHGKDSGTAFVLKHLIQHRLVEYGHMQDLTIDSENKKARLELLLKGEKESITLIVERYDLVTEGLHTYFVVQKASASREWVNRLIQEFVIEKRFLIPDKLVNLVKVAL